MQIQFTTVQAPRTRKTALASTFDAAAPEYLYACVSRQLPGVVKAGRTGRNPFLRAKEFSDISGLVMWEVFAIIAAPDSKPAETLMKRYLDGICKRHKAGKELWCTTPEKAAAMARKAAVETPLPALARRPWASTHMGVARRNTKAWSLALSLQVSCKALSPEPLSLAEIMGFIAQPAARNVAEKTLARNGILLTSFDEQEPRFRVYADSNSALTRWVNAHRLDWKQFGTQSGGSIREIFDIAAIQVQPSFVQ